MRSDLRLSDDRCLAAGIIGADAAEPNRPGASPPLSLMIAVSSLSLDSRERIEM